MRHREEDETRFLAQLAALAQRVMRADAVLCFRYDASHRGCGGEVQASEDCSSAIVDRCRQLAETAARSARTEIDREESTCLIATVSHTAGGGSTIVVSALDLGASALEAFVVTQQLITAAIGTWRARRSEVLVKRQQRLHDWMQTLGQSIEQSETPSQMARHIADTIAIELDAHQAAFCVTQGKDLSRIEVAAIGGNGVPVDKSLWQAAAAESILRSTPTRWPAAMPDEKVATFAHRELAQSLASHQATSVPLVDERGQAFAVLVVLAVEGSSDLPELSQLGDAIAANVLTWRADHQPRIARVGRAVSRLVETRWMLVAAFVVVGMVAMLPIPYRVSSTATVVPKTRSFVVAPHTGVLRKTSARVGDVVQKGSLIAELDDRELRIDMAALLAQRDQTTKQRDVHRADGNIAEEQLAEYELARVIEQIRLTEHRLRCLAVVSPMDGVVLEGELEDISGVPVETGQLLAEIASLEQLWIEINVPEEEISEIRVGQTARVAFDAADGSVLEAEIVSISPSAQVRNGENVFVARVMIDNHDGLLRPGIRGNAKINSDDRPVAAVLLRQLWRRVSRWWI